MVVHLYNGNLFKFKSFGSTEQMIRKLEITDFNNQDEFEKLVNRGKELFGFIMGIYDDYGNKTGIEFLWFQDGLVAKEMYYNIIDEI